MSDKIDLRVDNWRQFTDFKFPDVDFFDADECLFNFKNAFSLYKKFYEVRSYLVASFVDRYGDTISMSSYMISTSDHHFYGFCSHTFTEVQLPIVEALRKSYALYSVLLKSLSAIAKENLHLYEMITGVRLEHKGLLRSWHVPKSYLGILKPFVSQDPS